MGLDLDCLPTLLGFNIRRAQIALWRDFNRNFSDGDVRPGVFSAMLLANANPGIAQTDIASQLGIDKASVVSLVDRMEHAGWVERRRPPRTAAARASSSRRRREGLPLAQEGNDRPRAQVRDPLHRAGIAAAHLAAAPVARRRLSEHARCRHYRLPLLRW